MFTTKKELKIKDRNYKVNIEAFQSAMDVANSCRNRRITNSRFNDKSTDSFSKHWEGVNTYDEAMSLLSGGYQPTVEQLKDTMRISRQGNGKRISFRNNIQGFAPVVPLALKGVPNCMVDMSMKQIKCKVVDIYYDMTVPCYVDPQDIIKNGQKLLGAILRLEAEGYRFNLYAMQSYSDSGSADVLTVKVKSSDRPIDLKRISFPLTHPAFFRVIGFDWYSRFPLGKYRSGYGCALKHSIGMNGARELVKELYGDNAIYFAGTEILDNNEDYLKEVLTNAKSKA